MESLADYKSDMEYAHGNTDIMMKIMFPYLELLSKELYPNEQCPPVKLLQVFGANYPSLLWWMYRHGLIHNNYPQSLEVNGIKIHWSIMSGGIRLSKGYTYEDRVSGKLETITKRENDITYMINISLLHQKILECLKELSDKKTSERSLKSITDINNVNNFVKEEALTLLKSLNKNI